jgi:CDGSH iron-sulfur domain-containing protein 3
MGPTEKQDLMTTDLIMEDKKEFKSQATVELIDNGPIKITGNVLIKDSKRDITELLKEVSICRCSRSSNKPYCDGSHCKPK